MYVKNKTIGHGLINTMSQFTVNSTREWKSRFSANVCGYTA